MERLKMASRSSLPWPSCIILLVCTALQEPCSATGPAAVKKGDRFYLAIPVSYSLYKSDAAECGIPLEQVRCEGARDMTICKYSQDACAWAYVLDTASPEKVALKPTEKKCPGFSLAGEWAAVLLPTADECRKAVGAARDLTIEKVSGSYGTQMILRRKSAP